MVILNTCHIREKAAEKVFSDLGRLKPLKARKARAGGRMILAVAGCVAQAEGARDPARARPMSTSCSVRRPITACPRWWRARRARRRACSTPISRPRPSSTTCRSRDPRRGSRAFLIDAGRLRQVLHLLRRALYPRRGVLAAGARRFSPRRAGSSRTGAREITLLGPERQCLSRRSARRRRSGAWAGSSARSPRSPGWRASATPPRIPRDVDDELDRRASARCRSSCRSCICRCSRARTASSRR